MAANAIAMAPAIAVGRPGRRAASQRRSAEGGEWAVGIVRVGQAPWSAAKAREASRQQSSMVAVIQRVSSWCMAGSLG
jgi:hypothetical protein